MVTGRRVVYALCFGLALAASVAAMKGLLEKKIWYVNNNKTGEVTYWIVYLGEYSVNLQRKFPGEDTGSVTATVNFNLLSSGYIEGTGYSTKGKVSARADLAVRGPEGDKDVAFEDVSAITDFGRKIKLTNGTEGDFLLDIEGVMTPVKKTQLRTYKYKEVDGDRSLAENHDNTDLAVSILSFVPLGSSSGGAKKESGGAKK
jgi:hypothetical protein